MVSNLLVVIAAMRFLVALFSTIGMAWMLLMVFEVLIVEALSTQSSSKASAPVSFSKLSTVSLESVETSQVAVLDGAEWASIQAECMSRRTSSLKHRDRRTKYGYMTVVVGKDTSGQRLIGMQSYDDDNTIFEDSMAKLPASVSTADALSTYITGLTSVHAVLPKVEAIGGSKDSKDSMILAEGSKAVVLGGNDLACFAAQGLASFGIDVSIISTKNPKLSKSSGNQGGKIEILKPEIGKNQVGFAAHIGNFSALLDTISNERPLITSPVAITGEDGGGTNDDAEDDPPFYSLNDPFASPALGAPGSVLDLLRSRHKCETYISTMTESQRLMESEGIFSGPKKADEHTQRIEKESFFMNSLDCEAIPPPSGLGTTMEHLIGRGILFGASTKKNMHQKSEIVRGWTLADFWEGATWPQDTAGTAQVRFGMPVLDDEDLDVIYSQKVAVEDANIAASRSEMLMNSEPPKPIQDNPFVYQVAGVHGVETEIMEKKLDCVLFLSAKFCRTCRTISPQYTRLARIAREEKNSSTVFCKAEASGLWGKDLGRYLGVDAVPTFILFREGQQFGTPLSISKLPSQKLKHALDLLESGNDWDSTTLFDDNQ